MHHRIHNTDCFHTHLTQPYFLYLKNILKFSSLALDYPGFQEPALGFSVSCFHKICLNKKPLYQKQLKLEKMLEKNGNLEFYLQISCLQFLSHPKINIFSLITCLMTLSISTKQNICKPNSFKPLLTFYKDVMHTVGFTISRCKTVYKVQLASLMFWRVN